MAAADDGRRRDIDETAAAPAQGSGSSGGTDLERDGGLDRAATSVKANIDRVADKVKHLLGSDR